MKRNRKFILKYSFILLLILFIGGYTIFKAKNIIEGPVVNIEYPENGQKVENQEIEVRGKTQNVSFITLNGSEIFISENGDFKEKLLLSPGYNIIEMKVKDKFGDERKKQIELFYFEKFAKSAAKEKSTSLQEDLNQS